MIGIDLDMPHKALRQNLVYTQHCFTGCASTNILRLLPPLCFTKSMADDFIGRLKKAFARFRLNVDLWLIIIVINASS